MTTQELINLKSQVEQSKSKLSEMKGKKQVLMDTLKSKFNCSSIEEANKKVTQFEQEIEQLQKEKTETITKLEEEYEF
jgi:flagellar biosynthesis chaperone FliJ